MSEKIDIRSEAFKVTESENEEGENELVIEGIALPYNQRSRNGIVYTQESIEKAADSLEGKPFLFNHDPNMVLGKVTETIPKDSHLAFKAVANPGKDKVKDIKNGYVETVSIQAVVEEAEEEEGKMDVQEFLELSSAPIPGFDEAKAQAQSVRIEGFESMEQKDQVLIREPEVEGAQDSKWNPQDKEDFSSEDKYYEAHAIWFKKEPQETEDVAFEIAREDEEGELEINYEALNSAFDLAESDDDLTSDQVMELRSLLKDSREEWFEDKESLDGSDNSEEDRKGEPFAGYDDHEDCVSQNQDKSDPDAYCAVIKRKVEEIEDIDGESMSDETQEQDIEDLGDALDWLDANAPEEVTDIIVDAVQGEEESDDSEESEEESEEPEEESEEKFSKLKERLDELEGKLDNEEVSESKQPDAGSEDSDVSEESLAQSVRESIIGGEK